MADVYPDFPALPSKWLVDPADQPDYLDLPGVVLDESVSLGHALSDAFVELGMGENTAIVHYESGIELTFHDLAVRSDRLADGLVSLGLSPGDRVGLRVPNCPEGIIAAIAIWKVGAVLVPVPFIARPAELDFYLSDTAPRVLITDGRSSDFAVVVERATAGGVDHVIAFGADQVPEATVSWNELMESAPPRPAAEVRLDAVAVVWHTGGTTGVPKGCYHTQRRFLLAGLSYGAAAQSGQGQRWAAAAPIGHALGLIYHTIFTLLHGATIVMIERFTDPVNLVRAIGECEVTTFTAIAASWASMNAVIERGDAPVPNSLRTGYAMWQSSSSSEVADVWQARGITLLNNFGSTAFATWVLIPRFGTDVPRAALGSPAPGYEVRAVDTESGETLSAGGVGQMVVRGVSGLTYWRLPEKQRLDVRGGWTYVDDLIEDTGDEVFAYLGRTDFLISTSGNKVAPSEVERVISQHPAVKEVVVVGLPDPIRQECVAAFVVTNEHASENDELKRGLQELVKRELSPYKYPRIVEFLESLPRDHVGKVQPKLVREQALRSMQL